MSFGNNSRNHDRICYISRQVRLFPETYSLNTVVNPALSEFADDNIRVDCYIIAMSSVDRLLEEVAQLPEDQKLTLAYRLLASGEPPVTEEIEQEWDVLLRERIQRYDQDSAPSRSAGDVFSDIDRRLMK